MALSWAAGSPQVCALYNFVKARKCFSRRRSLIDGV